ncbi:hypothetical protein ABB37_07385 [Leptomonas pyrrhocoris]|uniref:Uncharacterized protein n=1 Tax=Leptomonas pyrrhocoris TaxID=157538 RepID=A0A0N1J4I1_LEPPY|nr:hypothetical protein ABB37_07385 [Leptomonas pyrrhocoris]XP_015655483.1 hypothetical protein ABB37_07385 [Leptomonas pyrrhocoris]XP_015655484.1 hypothetical protein ABB37_07385 [Leptomonas pyrrhocoris]KPA77043.1 hypothetical protein ABB37_07385 [Leptomonas pyrrhocoris]KPA77044.1 hypothetical protein ABB37_07385 [Leptomonas pyrrhocoris]KPA77045.1 hypothetical protein ABB37_07385 [Leptomonas pyrrhocoris]|eukprot:XP_015655482.1 hypothetical protein ABB37_07385 [Leptomonas pyrrhocoris]
MFTTENTVNEVVLKTVAFRHAAGFDDARACLRQITKPHANKSATWSSAEAAQTPNGRSSALLHTTPSFTFHAPSRGVTMENFSSYAAANVSSGVAGKTARNAHRAARSALRDALQRHEAALRAWADEPLQQTVGPQPLPFPRPSSRSATNAAASCFSKTQNAPNIRKSPNASAHAAVAAAVTIDTGGTPAAAASLSRVTLSVVQPYCRVLAKDSIAGIGLPRHRAEQNTAATGAKTTAATQPSHPEVQGGVSQGMADTGIGEKSAEVVAAEHTTENARCVASHETSFEAGGDAALQASASDTPQELHNKAEARSVAQGAPLDPYQLPLRMRYNAATSRSVRHDKGEEADERHTFLREQAARYAQWLNRQAAVLHQVAPDMWGRALPLYAALDCTPQVMDGGLPRYASAVRHFQHDSGVVYV